MRFLGSNATEMRWLPGFEGTSFAVGKEKEGMGTGAFLFSLA